MMATSACDMNKLFKQCNIGTCNTFRIYTHFSYVSTHIGSLRAAYTAAVDVVTGSNVLAADC